MAVFWPAYGSACHMSKWVCLSCQNYISTMVFEMVYSELNLTPERISMGLDFSLLISSPQLGDLS